MESRRFSKAKNYTVKMYGNKAWTGRKTKQYQVCGIISSSKLTSSRIEESDTQRLQALEEENHELRQLIRELTQENRALTWIIEKRRY